MVEFSLPGILENQARILVVELILLIDQSEEFNMGGVQLALESTLFIV